MNAQAGNAGAKSFWTLGDYAGFAEITRPVSLTVLDAVQPLAGREVLDLACGSGNFAVPAAAAGAQVTAIDITPELLELGRAAAAQAGVEVDFRHGDVEALELAHNSFDSVVSVLGIVAAADHERAAAELLRVCRPGGSFALTAWTSAGLVGEMFALIARIAAPVGRRQRPVDWGEEADVRRIFASVEQWQFSRPSVIFRGESAEDFAQQMERCIPPLVMAKAMLGAQGRFAELHDELVALLERHGEQTDDGFTAAAEYLMAVGQAPA